VRIAILVPLFPPKWLAGTEIATYNIAKHLAKKEHEVHVITSLDEGLPKEGMEQGFYIHRIRRRKVRFIGVILFWLKIWLAVKRIKPDVVHSQSVSMGVPGFMAQKFLRKPYLVWGRGSEIYLPWLFKELISKLVLKNANAVIALTEDMKKEMQKICNRGVPVIPNGIDLEKFGDLPTKEAIRGRLGLNNSDSVIVFVGSLRPVKGVKYLIQAMDIVRQKDTNARLMLVGDGEERDYLRSVVSELHLGRYVTFVGEVTNDDVPQYMIASDVFALPSLSEGFPVVSLEAMASGLPIVATKIGGLPEIIEDGRNGFLVKPREAKEIAEKVLHLLGDDDLRKRISENNKEKAKSYSWKSIVQRLEEIYPHHL